MEGSSQAVKKQRSFGAPSLDEFHGYLQALFPPTLKDDETPIVQFTEGAVVGLRQAYWTYLQHVASNLVEHDSLDDVNIVVQALTLNKGTANIVSQAQELLAVDANHQDTISATTKARASTSTSVYAKKKKQKRQKISADMEAEQERLLQKSKASVVRSQQQEESSMPPSSKQE
jgi:hypothetical protein